MFNLLPSNGILKLQFIKWGFLCFSYDPFFQCVAKSLVSQEAFAVVREASRRILGLRPFDVQLIGSMLHSI